MHHFYLFLVCFYLFLLEHIDREQNSSLSPSSEWHVSVAAYVVVIVVEGTGASTLALALGQSRHLQEGIMARSVEVVHPFLHHLGHLDPLELRVEPELFGVPPLRQFHRAERQLLGLAPRAGQPGIPRCHGNQDADESQELPAEHLDGLVGVCVPGIRHRCRKDCTQTVGVAFLHVCWRRQQAPRVHGLSPGDEAVDVVADQRVDEVAFVINVEVELHLRIENVLERPRPCSARGCHRPLENVH